jgi:hypothetical protein
MNTFECIAECTVNIHQQARPHLLIDICIHQLQLLSCMLLVNLDDLACALLLVLLVLLAIHLSQELLKL